MSRKRRNGRRGTRTQQKFEEMNYIIENNMAAEVEGPTRKKNWTKHDVKCVRPMTDTQADFFENYYNDFHVCAYGSAGTGKTFLATYLAINDVINPDARHKRVIFVRSVVPTRDIGHLPGTLDDKVSQYETPYRDILTELFGRASTYDDMKKAGLIQFLSTSYIRGTTWNDCVVVVDEMQNMTAHEIDSIMTRIGSNTRVIATGDLRQTDLTNKSRERTGMDRFLAIVDNIPNFEVSMFTRDDIVRSNFVKQWIVASEDYDDNPRS
jgi:phosphate starvation-inducible PhoH-like protein